MGSVFFAFWSILNKYNKHQSRTYEHTQQRINENKRSPASPNLSTVRSQVQVQLKLIALSQTVSPKSLLLQEGQNQN
jgi:hypothetical protein